MDPRHKSLPHTPGRDSRRIRREGRVARGEIDAKGGHSLPNAKPRKKAVRIPVPKTTSEITRPRVVLDVQSRFNPIRLLTPERLVVDIDRFKRGYLCEASLLWQEIKERDDKLRLVTSLREKAVARFGYQIAIEDGLDDVDKARAEEHQAALQSFYANLTTTCTSDENDIGGVKKLVRQMMDAVGSKYAVHEIVWQPRADGTLTAQFRFTPLWFFENTIAKLRYLMSQGAAEGIDLDEGGWMVTVGDGLMFASMIGYIFKTLPLRDWVTLSERNGMPIFLGKTSAAEGTPQWAAMVAAVEAIAVDFAAVMSQSETIEVVDLKGGQAAALYEALIKRMDAILSALWRGGDLSTMSSGQHSQGRGSNRQAEEAEILLDDDVEMINETLHLNVDKFVIKYLFGDDQPLAKFQIVMPPEEATAQDISIDQMLVSMAPLGEGLSWADACKRYGRVPAKKGEAILVAPQQDEVLPSNLGNERKPSSRQMAGAALISSTRSKLLPAQAKALKPLDDRISKILLSNDSDFEDQLRDTIYSLPEILEQVNADTSTADILFRGYTAAYLDGLTNQPAAA